ncbi:Organic hydroperoxide resistance transcriptional regulator [Roseibium album]|nr:Organic hydroperoxide resistance transcriptional regulator [Roseibium album]
MSDTTEQMSLLDAIGISAPTETKKTKIDQKTAAKAPSQVASKRHARKRKPSAVEGKKDKQAAVNRDKTLVDSTPDTTKKTKLPIDNTETKVQQVNTANSVLTLDQHLCFALYSANHAMHGVYKALLKDLGLTYPQFLAMTVLWETNNVPVGTLTTRLQLDTNTLTPLLKRLEGMDLLTRTRNKKDERQVIVKLTRKGRALQKKTDHFGSCIFSSTGLPLEEIVDLQSRIMKLRDNLRDADTKT